MGDDPKHEDIAMAAVGTIQHRICECPSLQQLRMDYAPEVLTMPMRNSEPVPDILMGAIATGLFPIPRLHLAPNCVPPQQGTFRWLRRARDDHTIQGNVFTDASRIHDVHPDTIKLGWAFIVVDLEGNVTDIASGVPPSYIEDIPGAETWALVQATTFASLGTKFTSDCLPCIDAIHRGRAATCTAKSPLARPLNVLFDNIGSLDPEAFVWMPSRTILRTWVV